MDEFRHDGFGTTAFTKNIQPKRISSTGLQR
jgi:hypothetical protein